MRFNVGDRIMYVRANNPLYGYTGVVEYIYDNSRRRLSSMEHMRVRFDAVPDSLTIIECRDAIKTTMIITSREDVSANPTKKIRSKRQTQNVKENNPDN